MHHVPHAQSWTDEISKKHSVPFDRRMEFTVSKLRRSGNHQGLYMLRCSPRDYDKYFMSFVVGVSSVNVCGEHSISHITAMQCNSLLQLMTAYIQADIKYEVRCLKSLRWNCTAVSQSKPCPLVFKNRKHTYLHMILITFSATRGSNKVWYLLAAGGLYLPAGHHTVTYWMCVLCLTLSVN